MVKKIRVINIVGAFVMGGAENMVYELAKALDPNRVESLVISISNRKGTGLEKKFDEAKINVQYAECDGRVTLGKLCKVYKIMKNFRPDVIHAHMSGVVYSLPWLLLHNCHMVVTAHTTPKEAFNSRVTMILKILTLFNKVTMVGVSEKNAELMKNYYGLDNSHIKYVNNGVDISRYYSQDHQNITFIHIGRLDDNKNQTLIISCFAKVHNLHPNVRLFICGDGPNMTKLKDFASSLNVLDDITFTGNVDNVQDYLAISDIYLQSSHREGLPLSVIEGMAASLPIISTNVGGMKNIVKENGFLVEDYDEDGYLNAMIRLYEDKGLRMEMGKISKGMTEPFSSVTMATNYTAIYCNK